MVWVANKSRVCGGAGTPHRTHPRQFEGSGCSWMFTCAPCTTEALSVTRLHGTADYHKALPHPAPVPQLQLAPLQVVVGVRVQVDQQHEPAGMGQDSQQGSQRNAGNCTEAQSLAGLNILCLQVLTDRSSHFPPAQQLICQQRATPHPSCPI